MLTDQERYMKEAIRQAKKARALEEVPIGCVIVCNGQIIARGYRQHESKSRMCRFCAESFGNGWL